MIHIAKQIISSLLIVALIASVAIVATFVRPAPALADADACDASGGEWVVIGTVPGTGQPEHSCTNCPEGMNGGASCTAGNSVDTGLTLQPIDQNIEGTHDCNGVPIAVDVECTEGENPILSYLGGVMNFLAAGVGVVVVAMVTFAGVQYITSRGDPQKVGAAKARLINALIGLVSFIFLYAFLQWLIPSGGGNVGPPDCSGGGPC